MSDPNADHEFSLAHGGQTYTIAVYNVRDDADGRVLYDIVVTDADGSVVLQDDFVLQNPPILVPDGTYQETVDEDGNVHLLPNMVEDLVQAFEIATSNAVRLQL